MRILFINPPYTNLGGIADSAGHMMPLSFGYLAAYARARVPDLEFSILDAEASGATFDDVRAWVLEFAPDVVGITAPTPALNHVFRLARIAKECRPQTTVVLGGVHATVMPESTISDCDAVDVLVIGEGEETFCELLTALRDQAGRFDDIAGLCFRQEGKPVRTPARSHITPLDSIPYPARDLYDLPLYKSAPTKKVSDEDATPILTSRGCPYDCIHCPSETIWQRAIRYRSTEDVLGEIEQCVHEFGLGEFNFFDDTFTINRKRVLDICQEISRRRLGISWIAFSRVNTIDDELVEHMQRAGCKKISFGLESGDQQILDRMRKKQTLDQCRQAVATVRRHGIPVHASFMLGNVGETAASIRRTIDFAKSLDLDNATFFITTPFPGTELYEIARDLGNITPETRWESFAPLTNAAPILVQDNLTAEELIYWQKRAFREFYLRARYVFKKVKLLASRDGIKTLFEGMRVLLRILRKRHRHADRSRVEGADT